MRPMLNNALFLSNAASVDSNQLPISTCWSLKVKDIALDVIGRRLVQVFHNTNTGGFLMMSLVKCDT